MIPCVSGKSREMTVTPVVNCRINWQSIIGTDNPVKIIVERSTGGKWSVSAFHLMGNLIGTSTGTDAELFPCKWFIITYKYTSSRDRLLWFDDLRIDGIFHEDNETSCYSGICLRRATLLFPRLWRTRSRWFHSPAENILKSPTERNLHIILKTGGCHPANRIISFLMWQLNLTE